MKFSQMKQKIGNCFKQRLVPFWNGVYGVYSKLRIKIGNPIVIDDASDKALAGLKLFGKSTQDGTPTPDAPVEIVSVENPTINIRNGIYLSDNYVKGVGIISTNGSQIVNSKSATTDFIPFDFNKYGEIKLSGVPSTLYTFIAAYDINKTFVGRTTATTIDLTYTVNNFTAGSGNGALDTIKYLRVTTYEADAIEGSLGDMEELKIWLEIPPYTEQDITVSIVNGLHGVPVTSGGNYTDANGQQWICDEVDFERGVYVQRCDLLDLKTREWNTWGVNYRTDGVTGFYSFIPKPKNQTVLCSILICRALDIWGGANVGCGADLSTKSYVILSVSNANLEDVSSNEAAITSLKKLLATSDAKLIVTLATPIETPLTADQIEAYRSLHTNEPNTTISNDQNAWMEVKYIAN